MPTENAETTENAAAVAEQGANVASEKAFSKKGASTKKGAPKGQKSAKGGKPKATAPKNAPKAKKAAKVQESAGPREGGRTQHGLFALEVEVSGADDIPVLRVKLDANTDGLRQFRGRQGGAATQEGVIHQPAPLGVVQDPFSEVWDAVQRQVQESPQLEAKTLFEWLQREYRGQFSDGQIRTLQRRIKLWRATEGPAQEVYFGQKHTPGRLCASDFTHMTELGITLEGQTFEHLVYHFVLTYSNWETGTICYSESLESLSEGWQNAIWELGAVPLEHRTDSLSSAVNNMSNLEEFNQRYEGVMKYCGVKPQHTNPASANENGDAEQSHHRFKRAVEQALLLRGSHDFGGMAEYAQFLRDLFAQRNAGRRTRLAEELVVMRDLPARRMESAKRERVRVDSGSLIHVDRNSYSVNSRPIGERVEARLYFNHVEVWYGQRKVEDRPRLRGRSKHRVDYRHIIEWLVRKPGAFESYRYQEDLFPTSRFRMAYDALKETTPSRYTKEYLKLLQLAAEEGEVQVDKALRELLEGTVEAVITVESIRELLAKLDTIPAVTMVEVAPVDLASFDQLCMEVRQ